MPVRGIRVIGRLKGLTLNLFLNLNLRIVGRVFVRWSFLSQFALFAKKPIEQLVRLSAADLFVVSKDLVF